jgi:hypothetical protein
LCDLLAKRYNHQAAWLDLTLQVRRNGIMIGSLNLGEIDANFGESAHLSTVN